MAPHPSTCSSVPGLLSVGIMESCEHGVLSVPRHANSDLTQSPGTSCLWGARGGVVVVGRGPGRAVGTCPSGYSRGDNVQGWEDVGQL